jgi:hypothetical protein
MHTAEPSVPECSSSEDEIATEELKRYKCIDQIPAKGGGDTCSEIQKLVIYIWNELP